MAEHRSRPRVVTLQRATVAWRRHLVTMMYLSGTHTVDSIVEELKERYNVEATVSSVSNDLAMQRSLYKDRQAETMDQIVDREVQKLDTLENIAMERSSPSAYIAGLDGCDGMDVVAELEKQTEEQGRRDDRFIDHMLKIQDRRSRLLGLDKPTRVELSGRDGGPIGVHNVSDSELERIAAGKRATA